jgi:pimeloyl-ACP methyl ester carboxylesterase
MIFGKPTINWGNNIFVVRTRNDFAKHSLMVALVDMPNDYKRKVGRKSWWIDYPRRKEMFRTSDEHAQDIKAVITYLKNKFNIPVWLVSTSRGTLSAASCAIRLKDKVDGVVLTASMTRTKEKWKRMHGVYPNYILSMELDQISVPTLIISHKDDKCFVTPPKGAQKIKNALVNSSNAKVMYFTGGKRPVEGICRGLSAHGFYGVEDQVVSAIAGFIKFNTRNP